MAIQLVHFGCPKNLVFEALEVPRATFYRNIKPCFYGPPKPRSRPANRIPEAKRKAILDLLHEVEFVDLTPWEIVPKLLDQGLYLGSIRTFYRVLSENGEVKERRLQSKRGKHAAPILEATGPNQIWTWDITRLKGQYHGKWYYLYLMLDLFSRYIVGWMVTETESARNAQHFIRETVNKHLKKGDKITLHSDRGAPMTANRTQELHGLLGLLQSLSRPRTSNDNPFSEAQFRTIKYHGSFPGFFETKEMAISHLEQFLTWYNNDHMHTGLNLHTPASVHFGQVGEIVRSRQQVLDEAYAMNPTRFANGRPIVKSNPDVVGINLHLKSLPVENGLGGEFQSEGVPDALHSAGILH